MKKELAGALLIFSTAACGPVSTNSNQLKDSVVGSQRPVASPSPIPAAVPARATAENPQKVSAKANNVLDESIRRAYEGKYFFPGEFHLNPRRMTTLANTWMNEKETRHGQDMGCTGYKADVNQAYVATWFYPCGTRLRLTNNFNGRSVEAVVADRGPNRKLTIKGWEDNRARRYAMDISPYIARVLDHKTGEGGRLTVDLISLPVGYGIRYASLDLVNSGEGYDGVGTR